MRSSPLRQILANRSDEPVRSLDPDRHALRVGTIAGLRPVCRDLILSDPWINQLGSNSPVFAKRRRCRDELLHAALPSRRTFRTSGSSALHHCSSETKARLIVRSCSSTVQQPQPATQMLRPRWMHGPNCVRRRRSTARTPRTSHLGNGLAHQPALK